MPLYLSERFEEFEHGAFPAQLFRFSIEEHRFIVVFSAVDVIDTEYHDFRSTEVGFSIPDRCYDVKFDREENFENETFYQPPAPGQCSRRYNFQTELADALETIIRLHHNVYYARAYFAVAENDKLKRYYDRILQSPPGDVVYEVQTGYGEGGRGYVLKTRYFRT